MRAHYDKHVNLCLCVQAEMALLMEDDGDEAKHKHFNYDKIVEQQNLSKKKKKKLLKKGEESLEDDFQVCGTAGPLYSKS